MDPKRPPDRPATLSEVLRDFVAFRPEDTAVLRELHPRISHCFPTLVEDFYQRIQQHPGTRRLLKGPEQLERLKGFLNEWLNEVFLGPHDEAYFERHRRIGVTHLRVGLPAFYAIGAMSHIRHDLQEAILQATMQEPRLREDGLAALAKILDVELALMTSSYHDEERYREFADFAPGIIHRVDPEGRMRKEEALREAMIRLEREASVDSVTGLYNHLFVQRRLVEEVERSRRTNEPLSCLVMDLDNFKAVNDIHGHAAGSDLLCQLARLLEATIRAYDVVARWGGDEFVVVLPSTGRGTALSFAQRLQSTVLDHEFLVDGRPYRLSMSVGVAIYPEDGQTGSSLFASADLAMYHAKRSGGGAIAVCDPDAAHLLPPNGIR